MEEGVFIPPADKGNGIDSAGGIDSKKRPIFKIMAFGDSLTEGWIDDGANFRPYTIRLQEFLDEAFQDQRSFEVHNKGFSGEFVVDQMTTRLPQLLKENKRYDLVIILGGTNDLSEASFGDERKIFDGLKLLHDLTKEYGAKSVAVTLPETDFYYKDLASNGTSYVKETGEKVRILLNEKLREYATQTNTCLCDLAKELPQTSLTAEELDKFWDDGLHFTAAGYERMAQILFETIKPLLIHYPLS